MTAPKFFTVYAGRLTDWCACLVIFISLLTLIGWSLGMSLLASFRESYIPMAPSSALCFLAVGVGLLLIRCSHRGLPRLMAGIVLLVAFAKLLEAPLGVHFWIDDQLVRDPGAFGSVRTGRMSPISAFTLVLLALGTYLAADAREKTAGPVATLAGAVSIVVLLGYGYGTPLLYGGGIVPVALTTAIAMFLCSIALLCSAGPEAWPARWFLESSTRALLLRSFLPAVVFITLLNGWVRATFYHTSLMNPAITSAVAAIFFALVMMGIISKVSTTVGRRIDAAEKARNRAQAELEAMNARLESLVEKRTRELQEKNSQMKEELEMARELQFALLPQKFPAIPTDASVGESAVRFLTYYFPTGDVSGDFFTVFPVADKAVGIFICDVMGHGVRAALVTSMIRALVEECGHEALAPGAMLTRINQGLVAILAQAGTTMYATGCYVVVNVENREMLYATAGHPRPLLVSRASHQVASLSVAGVSGPALGIFPKAEYGMNRHSIAKGDLIMMFTDGLLEVEGSEGMMFDEELLLASIRRNMAFPPNEFFDRVIKEVRSFSVSQAFDDDVCLIGIEVQNLDLKVSQRNGLK